HRSGVQTGSSGADRVACWRNLDSSRPHPARLGAKHLEPAAPPAALPVLRGRRLAAVGDSIVGSVQRCDPAWRANHHAAHGRGSSVHSAAQPYPWRNDLRDAEPTGAVRLRQAGHVIDAAKGVCPMKQPMRGIFPVLQTPLDANGELDVEGLRREVRFCIEAGGHGLVSPALGSELQYLSDRERQQLVEVVVGEARGQVPVIVGVSAPSAAIAAEHARHAGRAQARAVMALPPYITPGSPDEIRDYYRAIGQAADLPVVVQNAAPGLSPDFLIRLLREVEQIRYIKEEASPSAHNLSAVMRATGDRCDGIFGGAFGRWMLSELRRGACGFMPAAEVVDVYVQVWDAFESGD